MTVAFRVLAHKCLLPAVMCAVLSFSEKRDYATHVSNDVGDCYVHNTRCYGSRESVSASKK